jgi:hypothetical protein
MCDNASAYFAPLSASFYRPPVDAAHSLHASHMQSSTNCTRAATERSNLFYGLCYSAQVRAQNLRRRIALIQKLYRQTLTIALIKLNSISGRGLPKSYATL